MPKELWLPLFPVGEYRSSGGALVNLTAEKLREMERNTKFNIKRGLLAKPPVGYKHPASQGEARGHIGDVRFENGVLHARVDDPKFIDDVKSGRRLEYSGEFMEEMSGVIDGKPVTVGPCVVGIAILGSERPAIKNPARRTLSELVFAEGITPVDAWEIREELRKTGLVSQTFAEDGTYCFSEIQIDPQIFEENTHMPLTAEDLAQIGNLLDGRIKTAVDSAVTPLSTKLTTMEADTKKELQKFSEEVRTESKIIDTLDTIRKERKLGKIPMERLEKALREPSFDTVKAFAEVAPTAAVTLGEQHGDESGGKKEPDALKKLRVSDFNEPSKHDALIHAGLQAFSEAEPTKWSVVADKPHAAKLEALKTHIAQRDASAN